MRFRVLLAGLCVVALQAQSQAFRLPSGLSCLLLEKHDQPLIRLELVTRWDLAEEPAGKEGLAGLLAEVMAAGGAGPYSRAEFNRAADDLGLAFRFQGHRNALVWGLATDSRSQEAAFELLADAVFRPVFDQALLEGRRQAMLRQAQDGAPGNGRLLWHLRDPGLGAPPDGEGLEALTLDDLTSFRARVVRPEASTLVLAGDLSLAQAKELVFLHFGLWGPRPQARLGEPSAPAGAARLLVAPQAGSEAQLWAGSPSSSCSPAVATLLSLLLEQVPAVVAPAVVRTCLLEPGHPLLLKVQAGADRADELVAALQDTLDYLRGHAFTGHDLERAKQRWKARMLALPLHPGDQIRAAQEQLLDPALPRQVEAVGLDELREALTAMLRPGRPSYLVLGGARLVEAAVKAGFGTPAEPKVRP